MTSSAIFLQDSHDADLVAARRAVLKRDGAVMIEHALLPRDLTAMAALFAAGRPGRRLDASAAADIKRLAMHPSLCRLVAELGGPELRLVRVVAFDKSPKANWFVPWHQDRSIAVASQSDAPGYSAWTTTNGSIDVEPPVSVLEAMLTLRVHIDACDEDNGPLEILRGGHRLGRLDKEAIAALVAAHPTALCLAAPGDILALKSLLPHRSQRARVPRRRRVLHIDYGPALLPSGVRWALPH